MGRRVVVFEEAHGAWIMREGAETFVGPLDELVARAFGIRNGPRLASLAHELERLKKKRTWYERIKKRWGLTNE